MLIVFVHPVVDRMRANALPRSSAIHFVRRVLDLDISTRSPDLLNASLALALECVASVSVVPRSGETWTSVQV